MKSRDSTSWPAQRKKKRLLVSSLKTWNGRRDSNPRRPAWQPEPRLKIRDICVKGGIPDHQNALSLRASFENPPIRSKRCTVLILPSGTLIPLAGGRPDSVLSDEFYNEILAHPSPTDLDSVKVLASARAVLDVMWLVYRCVVAKREVQISLFWRLRFNRAVGVSRIGNNQGVFESHLPEARYDQSHRYTNGGASELCFNDG